VRLKKKSLGGCRSWPGRLTISPTSAEDSGGAAQRESAWRIPFVAGSPNDLADKRRGLAGHRSLRNGNEDGIEHIGLDQQKLSTPVQAVSSAPAPSAVAAADESRLGRWSARYRPRGRLSRRAGIAPPADGPVRFKLSWGGNASRPTSRHSLRVGKSGEAGRRPAVGDQPSAMLSAGRICRQHAGRERSTPVPPLAAPGRRGSFAPALGHRSRAARVSTAVSCSGPGRRDAEPLPALSVIRSSRHRAGRRRPSPPEISIQTMGRAGPASRVPHTPAAPPMPDPGRGVGQPPPALSLLPSRRQRAAHWLPRPIGLTTATRFHRMDGYLTSSSWKSRGSRWGA